MLNGTRQYIPQEFGIQIIERYGWINNVYLILNNDYSNPISLEWSGRVVMKNGVRYSLFSTVCDLGEYPVNLDDYNSVQFFYSINGCEKASRVETFYIYSD